jgi:hypothetical protein
VSESDAQAERTGEDHSHEKTTEFSVDGEEFSTPEKTLTPRQIMTIAGVDPATHYLVEIKKHGEQESFEGRPEVPISMHDELQFVTISSGPTPVS